MTTDQRVGDSSSPRRADETPAYAGVSSRGGNSALNTEVLWEPFSGAIRVRSVEDEGGRSIAFWVVGVLCGYARMSDSVFPPLVPA